MDELVQSITGLGKDLTMFSARGFGQNIAGALGALQAEAGIASQQNIQEFAKIMLNSSEGIAIAAQAGVMDTLMALGTKQGATKENLNRLIAAIAASFKRFTGSFENAIIAGMATRGTMFEQMIPIAELDDSIRNMTEQQKHRERIDRDFSNTISTLNEELFNPLKEFVVNNMEIIKFFASAVGRLIKWTASIAGIFAIVKGIGHLLIGINRLVTTLQTQNKTQSIKDLLGSYISGNTGNLRTTILKTARNMRRTLPRTGAARGVGILSNLTRVFSRLGPIFLGLGKWLAKGLLRMVPFIGTAMLLFDLGKMTYDALKGINKNTQKTAEEIERERQRQERMKRSQDQTISTLDKTLVALINITRNDRQDLLLKLEQIQQNTQKTAQNTQPQPTPPSQRGDPRK